MKKIILLLSGILMVSSMASAKEYAAKPERSKEIVAEPVVAEEVVTVAPVVEPTPVVVTPESYLTLRLGVDAAPRYKKATFGNAVDARNINDNSGDNWGGEVGLEYLRQISDTNLFLGAGAAYQRHADVKSSNDNVWHVGRYDSIPLYVTGKYIFTDWNGWKPYAKADLGYSFNRKSGDFSYKSAPDKLSSGKIKDGMYWGAGLGVEYYNWTADVMYKVNTAKLDMNQGGSEKFDYSRVTVGVGYKFDL